MISLRHFAVYRSFYLHIFGHIDFAANYRFYFTLSFVVDKLKWIRLGIGILYCLLYKLQRSVHIAVIGYSNSLYVKLVGSFKHICKPYSSVKQAIFGMHVQMSKFPSHYLSSVVDFGISFAIFSNFFNLYFIVLLLTPNSDASSS